tara:strand:- start:26 stop:457 length:432 start_codon:yes stop_codon:yes gene_type:complete
LTQPHSATHLVRGRGGVRVRTRVRVAAQGDARGELVEPDSLGALLAAVHMRAAALRHDECVLHVHGREAHLVRGRVRVGFRVRVRVGVRVRVEVRVRVRVSPNVHGREAHVEVDRARADDRRHRAHRGVHDEAPLRSERRPPG